MRKAIAIILCIIFVLAFSFPTAAITSVPVKGITLNISDITLGLHASRNLVAKLTPANTTSKLLTYVTSDRKVATVDANGKITTIGLGKATITVYTQDKSIFAKCTVTVYQVPVTLSIFGLVTGAYANGIQTDPIAIEIKKRTGVTMKFDFVMSVPKMQAKMASGDLDDIWITRQDLTEAQIKGHMLIPLDSLIATRGPDIIKNAPKMLQFVKDNFSYGTGKIYMLNGILDPGGDPQFQQEPYIRWDYYKEMGYPKVTNLDQLADVLIAMQKNHPTTDVGKKTYATGFYVDQGADTLGLPGGSFFGMGAGMISADNNDYATIYDIFNAKNPVMTSAKFYNKLYRAGILDPDSATQGYSDFLAKSKGNNYLCQFLAWGGCVEANAAFAQTGDEKGYLPIAPPDGTATVGGWATPYGAFGKRLAITSACRYKERAMDLLNYLYSYDGARTINSGVQGQLYDMVDGKLKYNEGVLDTMAIDPDFNNKNAIGKYNNMSGLSSNYKDENGQYMNLLLDPIANPPGDVKLTPLQKEAASYYGISDPLSWPDIQKKIFIKKNYKNYMVNNSLGLLIPTTPGDLNTMNLKGQEVIKNAVVTMIMANDDSTFDSLKAKMFSDLRAIGYDKYLSWYEDANAKAIAKAKALMN